MGKGTSSVQQAPEQGVSPEVAPKVVVPENTLMAAQQLSGGGNAWVQEQMKAQLSGEGAAQAQATQDAARSLDAALDGGDVQEAAPEIEAALKEGEAAAEGLEEGGGITTDTPPGDGAPASDEPTAMEGPSVEGPVEAVAEPTEVGAAEAAPAETSGATTRDAEKKEFARVYRSTSASETDAWLDGLEVREATNPALVGLAAELRAWVKQKREEKAAKKQAAAPPVAAPTTAPATPEAEEGVWAWLASAKQTVVEGWDSLTAWWSGVKTSVAEGWAWATGSDASEALLTERGRKSGPGEDIELDVQHYDQNEFYGSDGEPLDAEMAKDVKAKLVKHGLWGEYGAFFDAYSAYLEKEPSSRSATLTHNNKSYDVPQDIQELPALKFIPGGASCLRASKAMAKPTGATPVGGSGVVDSHFQTVFDSDQEVERSAEGEVVKYNHGTHEGRVTKESDELGDGRVKQIGANVQLSAAYLDAELEAGRAVVVGVTYTARNGNSDKTTDHWITVTGRKSGAYVFLDPAFESGEAKGTFTIDDAQGGVMEAHINGRVYTLAQVQLNTASAGNPSSVDGEKSWKQVAKDANQQFGEDTPEGKALGW